ncbi:MAG: hypothetical protein R2726_10700 [Acidimicrobiales bacterium]
MGTGPWKLKEWTKGARLVASLLGQVLAEGRVGNQLPYLEEVETRLLLDPKTRTQGSRPAI